MKDWSNVLDRIKGFKLSDLPSREAILSTLLKAAGRIPFADDVVAMYYCAIDPATPSKIKAMIVAALAYFVLPVDLIPDVVVGIGFTDDIAVLTATFALVSAHIKPEHREKAARTLKGAPSFPEDSPVKPL